MSEAGTTGTPRGHRDRRGPRHRRGHRAVRLAQDGFAVAVLDLDEASAKGTVDAIEAAGGRALAVGADVSDAEQVEAAVDRIAAELGRADRAGQQRRRHSATTCCSR